MSKLFARIPDLTHDGLRAVASACNLPVTDTLTAIVDAALGRTNPHWPTVRRALTEYKAARDQGDEVAA